LNKTDDYIDNGYMLFYRYYK